MTFQHIRALLLDMDGVLWRGAEPIGSLVNIFQRCQEKRLQVRFITNNSTRTPQDFAAKLGRLGVIVSPDQVLTSSVASAARLRADFPHGRQVYAIGEAGLQQALTAAGFSLGAQNAVAVVAGLDTHLTYEKIAQAARLILAGRPFYGTNPDPTLPTPDGPAPGAGAVLAAIATASGQAPQIIGKPQPELFQQAIQQLQLEAHQCLVVGDRYETDIRGGQAAGCPTALVLSGATRSATGLLPAPDVVAPDLASLVEQL